MALSDGHNRRECQPALELFVACSVTVETSRGNRVQGPPATQRVFALLGAHSLVRLGVIVPRLYGALSRRHRVWMRWVCAPDRLSAPSARMDADQEARFSPWT